MVMPEFVHLKNLTALDSRSDGRKLGFYLFKSSLKLTARLNAVDCCLTTRERERGID